MYYYSAPHNCVVYIIMQPVFTDMCILFFQVDTKWINVLPVEALTSFTCYISFSLQIIVSFRTTGSFKFSRTSSWSASSLCTFCCSYFNQHTAVLLSTLDMAFSISARLHSISTGLILVITDSVVVCLLVVVLNLLLNNVGVQQNRV